MTRDEIGALLPFYANGTLDGAERAAVEAALAEDAGLRAELAALRAIRETMQAEPVQAPGEFGLARLLREIERDRAAAPVSSPAPAAGRGVSGLWRVAAVLALALALGQLVWSGLQPAPGEGPAVTLAGGEGPGFLLGFAPGATEAELRELLLDLDLVIIDGPTAVGFYRVVPGDPEAADMAALRAALAASPIVESLDDTAN